MVLDFFVSMEEQKKKYQLNIKSRNKKGMEKLKITQLKGISKCKSNQTQTNCIELMKIY